MFKFTNPTLDSGLDFLADHPALMAFLVIGIPLIGAVLWALASDKQEERDRLRSRHRMSNKAQPMSSYFLNKDRGEDFDFDFSQITLWVNEIDESKEYA